MDKRLLVAALPVLWSIGFFVFAVVALSRDFIVGVVVALAVSVVSLVIAARRLRRADG